MMSHNVVLQTSSFPALRCGGLPTRLGPSRAAPFRCQQPHAAIRPVIQHFRTCSRRVPVAHARSTGSNGDRGETRPGPLPAEDAAAQTKAERAAFGPGDGASGMLRGLDGVGAGGTGGAANEDRRQQAAEAVAARLRQEVEPVTRALAGVQDTLQELANQQARFVQHNEQLQQEDKQQQQQQPVPDPKRWWHSVFVNRTSTDAVTQRLEQQTVALREALQQHHGEVQRELVGRLGAQGRELPAAVALAVQQQMGRRDVVNGAMLGAAVVLGFGLGRLELNAPLAPAADTSRPTPTPILAEASAQPGGAVGEGTALSGEGSSSGSGSTGSGEGGVGLVKHKVSGNSGGAGSVFVPPRAATANEVELLKLCDRVRPKVDAVRQLLAAGTAVNVSDKDGSTPLHLAVVWDHVELVGLLLAAGANPSCCDKIGCTPLHTARSRLAVEQLVGAGAPLEARTFKDDWTPLHARVVYDCVEAAEALIRAGADTSPHDSSSSTPLHVAVKKGYFEAARLLLRCGADVEAKDKYGWTPLVHAVRDDQPLMARLLLKAGADRKARDNARAIEYFAKSKVMSAILDAA